MRDHHDGPARPDVPAAITRSVRALTVAALVAVGGCGGEEAATPPDRPPTTSTTSPTTEPQPTTSTATTAVAATTASTTTTVAAPTTTTAVTNEYGTLGAPALGADCATLLAIGGAHGSRFPYGGVAFATVPGEAVLVWGYADPGAVQHFATIRADGAVVGNYRYDDPAGMPWDALIDAAFAEQSWAVRFTPAGERLACTPADEFQLGTQPGA